MPAPAPIQNQRRWAFVFWSLCVLAAPPIAFATAAAGFGMSVAEPLRDVALIVLASVAEEIVFRGALQPALAGWLERRSERAGRRGAALLTPANVATSLLFAAFHLWGHPLAVAAAVFPVSLVLGRARELSGRTWPAASLHVYFNLLLYAASALLAAGR
jgi:membrane protease YdiL (CAAX protease family)